MTQQTQEGQPLKIGPILILVALALTWGSNMAVIKIGGRELPPLFMAGLRSLLAAACLFGWMTFRKTPPFPAARLTWMGAAAGALFACEFALIYIGLQYTLASRSHLLVYTAPFFAAIGAHLFLQGDRIHLFKGVGLVLAFAGVALLFPLKDFTFASSRLPGDLMALAGGIMWGFTTVYIKRYLAGRSRPQQSLFLQLFFSAPLLMAASLLTGEHWVLPATPGGIFSLFYQSVIIAFVSYTIWFELVERFPVSLLHAFSFLTPVFGVFWGGMFLLGEEVNWRMYAALGLVCAGLFFVNRHARPVKERKPAA